MSDNLLTQRRFLPYFCTQFLGAFNDNIYKSALIIMVTYRLVSENQGVLVNVAAILFILPFFLFGSLAGQLADKYEKAWLIQNIKLAEIGIMILGCIAIFLASVPLMLLILFLMGTQSAFSVQLSTAFCRSILNEPVFYRLMVLLRRPRLSPFYLAQCSGGCWPEMHLTIFGLC